MATARITGVNENISTYGDGTRDFTNLNTWEFNTDNDLVTAQISEVIEAYPDASPYNDWLAPAGATTNASYRRIFRAAAGHEHKGDPTAGVQFASTNTNSGVVITEHYFVVQDLHFNWQAITPIARAAIQVSGVDFVAVIGCLIKAVNGGSGVAYGYYSATASADNIWLADNIIYECEDAGVYITNATGSCYIYNCTSCDNAYGYRRTAGTVVVKNCLAHGNTIAFSDFNGTFDAASDYNASEDTTAPGANSRISQTFTFRDSANDDYRLDAADAGARGFGIDLSGDPTFPFDDDIEMETIATWSIGADSVGAGAASSAGWIPPYRRRRR